jgi:hypothetical protein
VLTVGTAGIAELAPVESRGKYVGIAYILILPFAASSGYGILHLLCDTDIQLNCIPYQQLGDGVRGSMLSSTEALLECFCSSTGLLLESILVNSLNCRFLHALIILGLYYLWAGLLFSFWGYPGEDTNSTFHLK